MSILISFKLTCDVASVFSLLFTPSSFVHEQPLSATWSSGNARWPKSFATGSIHGWSLLHLILYRVAADYNGTSSLGRLPSILLNFLIGSNKCSLALLLAFRKCVVTFTSAEQSFRKLKLIKTFNRSNPPDSRLSFYLLAFLSTYRRKRRGATRVRIRVAGHLSTPLRWGNPIKCLSQWYDKQT